MNAAELDDYKKRHKAPLWGTFSLSVLAHVAVVGLLGGVVVFKVFERPPAQFAPPPPPAQPRIDPRKIEHQVKVKQQQQKSGRPRVSPRLSANKIADFSLPEIKADAVKIKDPIKAVDVRSFGGSGRGVGAGSGSGSGGLGLGTSQLMVFGVKAQTERVAILIDLSPSMVHDERGGFPGYDALKREIKEVIRSLSEGSFFNLIAFDSGLDVFKPEAVIANRKAKDEAGTWIDKYMKDPYNVRGNGTSEHKYAFRPETPMLPSWGGLTRQDWALAAAMESGVDTIFLVTDGVYNITKMPTPEFVKEWKRIREDPKNQKKIAQAGAEYEEKLRKEAEERAKRGLPPKVVEDRGGSANLEQVKVPGPGKYNDAEMLDYVKKLTKTLYVDKGKKPPRIYVIGYISDDKDESFLHQLATRNGGTFRRTRTLVKPINGEVTVQRKAGVPQP